MAKINTLDEEIHSLRQSISSNEQELQRLSDAMTPDTTAIDTERALALSARTNADKQELDKLEALLMAKKQEAAKRRLTLPQVDKNQYISQVQSELESIAALEVTFDDVARSFDMLFGGSPKARELLEQRFEAEFANSAEDALDELLSLSQNIDAISYSLSKVSSNIHTDTYSRAMGIVFPNFGQLFQTMPAQTLLFVYIFYYLIFLVLFLYFPEFTAVPLALLMLLAMSVSFQKYANLLKAFVKAFRIRCLASNAEAILTKGIEEKIAEEKARLVEESKIEAGKLSADADALSEDLLVLQESQAIDFAEFRRVLDDKYDQRHGFLLADIKEIATQHSALSATIAELRTSLISLLDQREALVASISDCEGISSPVTERQDILDPVFLVGLDDVTAEPVLFNASAPTLLKGTMQDKITFIKTISTQLMARMVPSKVEIVVYDPLSLGMDFLAFMDTEFKGKGLTAIAKREEFEEWYKQMEVDIYNFKYSLADFGNIHKYNDYMSSINSVTRKYIFIFLLDHLEIANIKGYTPDLGIYWISAVESSDPKIQLKHAESFGTTFPVNFQ